MKPQDFADVFREEVRSAVRAELEANAARLSEWIDQYASPLGKRKHLELARTGELQASKVGKRVLVKRSVMEAYILAHPMRVAASEPSDDEDLTADMDATLAAKGYRLKRTG